MMNENPFVQGYYTKVINERAYTQILEDMVPWRIEPKRKPDGPAVVVLKRQYALAQHQGNKAGMKRVERQLEAHRDRYGG